MFLFLLFLASPYLLASESAPLTKKSDPIIAAIEYAIEYSDPVSLKEALDQLYGKNDKRTCQTMRAMIDPYSLNLDLLYEKAQEICVQKEAATKTYWNRAFCKDISAGIVSFVAGAFNAVTFIWKPITQDEQMSLQEITTASLTTLFFSFYSIKKFKNAFENRRIQCELAQARAIKLLLEKRSGFQHV